MLFVRAAGRLRLPRHVAAARTAAATRSFAATAGRCSESAATEAPASTAPASATATATATPTTEISPPATTTPATKTAALPQAPNRDGVWTRSQQAREAAMTGPRFEQTDFSLQPQPYSAMELIHQQPVRWTHDRVVSCAGAPGSEGHPRIFINTDKPQIAVCGYCGLPYANEHHRAHIEALPQTSYPLS